MSGDFDGWTEVGYIDETEATPTDRPSFGAASSGLRITLEVDGEEVDPTTPCYWAPELGRVVPKGQPIEGSIVERDRTRLPQAFIEGTTEYDYPELPAELRAALEDWCDAFVTWDRERRQ